ncbi:MAG: glycosyltransferase [Candidatus Cloacimonetes bacterium]|nr:glycosyltransferase [Candidatus Cloacimonadota bacterium]
MRKIAFVIPWFGMDIPGGAESECRETAFHLKEKGIDVEILTTCVKDFYSNWSKNHWKEAVYNENGLTVRRFKADKRDTKLFDYINHKLMNGVVPIPVEQKAYMDNMVNSFNLISFIKKNQKKYWYFFIPYMFGTTYNGVLAAPSSSYLVPCLHDESYAYMDIYKEMFKKAKGVVFQVKSEKKLAEKIYNLTFSNKMIFGTGLNTDISFNKKDLGFPFILYAGKKDAGKGTNLLIEHFIKFKKENVSDLRLVLIGAGDMLIPEHPDIIDKGFVSKEEKYDLMASSLCLCNPSINESFSLVVMESWLCQRPVLVNGKCEVTKDHCIDSNGGLWFDDYDDFKGSINYCMNNETIISQMAMNGKKYVLKNYSWDTITKKYIELIKDAN